MSVAGTQGVKLYVFILVLNMIFPVMSYTFTTFGATPENYELDLDMNSLMEIGLNLLDGESQNMSWDSGLWNNYTLVNVTVRATWAPWREQWGQPYTDGIEFQKQSALSLAFNGWFASYTVDIKSVITNEWFDVLRNDTIVRDYDQNHNWSRFILKDGHHVFITSFESHENITQAVYEDGTLNVTIAKSYDESEDRFNFWSFIKWYGGLLIGDQSWGLPSVFSWIIRLITAISFLASILLIKELTRV